MDILDKAIIYATKKHSGSLRKGGKIPYIVHPLEAASVAASITDDKEVIAAAVLHDVIEDAGVTENELKKEFGDRITALVMSDTEDKMRNIPAKDSWQTRKQRTLDFLKTATRDEQIVCLSDKLSNMRAIFRDYELIKDELWQRFNVKEKTKHYAYYSGIADRLIKVADTAAWKEYRMLTDKVFGDRTKNELPPEL